MRYGFISGRVTYFYNKAGEHFRDCAGKDRRRRHLLLIEGAAEAQPAQNRADLVRRPARDAEVIELLPAAMRAHRLGNVEQDRGSGVPSVSYVPREARRRLFE